MTDHHERMKRVAKAAVYGKFLHAYQRRRRIQQVIFATNLLAVLLISIVLEVWLQIKPPTYQLEQSAYSLIGDSRDDTSEYLKHDETKNVFSFEVPKNENSDESAQHFGRENDVYSATLNADAKKGITYTDNKNNIDITVRPQFFTAEGRKVDGDHIVYPSGETNLIYTLKYNGLKEDIVVPKYTGSAEQNYNFELVLPSGVEARLDAQGNIGIYSADPTLYGDISFGSEEDRARVDKARENGSKTNLVATIPFPLVKDGNGKEYSDKAVFKLSDKQQEQAKVTDKNLPAEVAAKMKSQTTKNVYDLSIQARDLQDLSYPISIDPTITTTSASDFQQGNGLGIDFDTSSNSIKRASINGGVTNSWTVDTGSDFSGTVMQHSSVAYNGYLYILGGHAGSSPLATIQYAPITLSSCASSSTTGCIGGWQTASNSLNSGVSEATAVAYNGYMYVFGGRNTVGTTVATVQFAKINSNGSLGTWSTTTSMNTARIWARAATYNGYLYVVGGCSSNSICTSPLATTEFGKVNADGTVTSWTTDGNSFSNARGVHVTVIYNGFLYLVAGGNSTNRYADAQYTKINSDGSLSAWITTTSLSSNRDSLMGAVINGYLYVSGGCTSGSCSSLLTETAYAQINADGSLGTWRTTTALGAGRYSAASAFYNGYFFQTGGCVNTAASCSGGISSTSQYTSVKPAGEVHNASWTSGSNYSATGRLGIASIAANGYIYAVGGYTAGGSATSEVDYAAINADGSLGTWTTSGSNLPAARAYTTTIAAYDGYLYYVGGCTTVVANTCTVTTTNTYYGLIAANGSVTWSTDSSNPLTNPHVSGAVMAYNGYVYAMGGDASTQTVEYASIASDHSLNSWTADGDTLGTGRSWFTATAYNGYLYVSGGNAGSTYFNTTEYSQIGASGNPGAWSAGPTMNTARAGHGMVVQKGYMYVYSGRPDSGGSSTTATAEYTRIASNGTLVGWTSTQSVTSGRYYLGAATAGGVLYMVGGYNGSAITNTSEYQYINNGGSGTLPSFSTTATLATARHSHVSLVNNGYMYVIGGCTGTSSGCSAVTGTVEKAAIGSDGLLGTFSTTGVSALNTARHGHAGVAYNGRLYVAGGYTTTTGTVVATLEYTTPDASGNISSWTTDVGGDFSGARRDFVLTAYNGFLYVVGGDAASTTQNDTQYAPINSGGDPGSWTTDSGGNFTTARLGHSGGIYSGYLYVVGGCSTFGSCGGANDLTDIQYAPVNSDGSIGTWFTAGGRLSVGRYGGKAAISNGFMYIAGGIEGAGNQTAVVEYAPILANGNVGTFGNTPSLANARHSNGVAIANGILFVVGGKQNTSSLNTVEYGRLSSIPRAGSYSRLMEFGSGVKPTKLITRGNKRTGATVSINYQTVNNTSSTFTNSQNSSDIGYTGANGLAFALGSNVTLTRYLWLRYQIDESQAAVFPDYDNETTLTDYDIYFTANPGKRLKGGRTFTGGSDSKLQANP